MHLHHVSLLHTQKDSLFESSTDVSHACGQRGCREGGRLFGDEVGRLLQSVCDQAVLMQRVNLCMTLFFNYFNPSPVTAGKNFSTWSTKWLESFYYACNSKEHLLLVELVAVLFHTASGNFATGSHSTSLSVLSAERSVLLKPLELMLGAIHLSTAWGAALRRYCVGPLRRTHLRP